MDHWGDPWADHATDESPTKKAVTSPQPPAFTFAPGPINGFVDDAGWGDNDDDDGFGDWAAGDMGNGAASLGGLETRAGEAAEEWPEIVAPMPRVLDKVDSETSDSSTVAQLEEAASQIGAEDESDEGDEGEDDDDDDDIDIDVDNSTPTPQAELESSVRSSTSPSETSRNEVPIESPRTSIDDDRTGRKDEEPHQEPSAVPAESNTNAVDAGLDVHLASEDTASNDPHITDDREEPAASTVDTPQHPSRPPSVDLVESGEEDGELDSTVPGATNQNTYSPDAPSADALGDKTLMAQLFPASKESDMQLEDHSDPIFSTSARKTWYRLTRKQTMREYNHGENDDNYVRVTWTNSNVRTEVNKVVSRWAREDRISGTGPGARASFYWDSPAPPEAKAPFSHLRTQSSAPATKTALPARQSLPPLAASQSAAFDWSSPASADPWKTESPAQRSSSGSSALKNPTVAKLQRQEGRAVSVDLTPRRSEQTAHKRTATTSHVAPETRVVPNLISPAIPPITQPSAEPSDSWTNLNSFDAPSTSTVEVAEAPADDDDDDDWGEMVQTPTLPTPQQLDPFPLPATARDILPSPALPTSSSPVVTPVQGEPTEPMFASPIVRLKSTISPTSALFKANAFIPLHVEQGPIGPGLLKPANRGPRSTSGKKLEIDTSGSSKPDSAPVAAVATKASENGSSEILSFLDTSDPMPSPPGFEDVTVAPLQAATSTPIAQPNTPVQAPADSWADADFSFFESAPPAPKPQQPPPAHNPSDPFSFFDAPAPPSTHAPSRTPPHTTTPPTLQPLANATSSLHRRKAEEDQLVFDILSGLPDLRYMLR